MFGLGILKGLALCFKQRLKLVLAIQKGLVLKVKVTNGYEKNETIEKFEVKTIGSNFLNFKVIIYCIHISMRI